MPSIGIITAMKTEVWSLVRTWRVVEREHNSRRYQFFENANAVVLAGGIGCEAGKRATEAMVACYGPRVLIASGLAGGLKPEWAPPRTMIAARVIDEATGRTFRTAGGEGTIISSCAIAGAAKKRELAARFAADVVDMESAAVAEVAEANAVRFLAVKAISDELDFDFPPLQPYVDREGNFQAARFTVHAVFHPRWWPMIWELQRKTDRAAEALARVLEQVIREQTSNNIRLKMPASAFNLG